MLSKIQVVLPRWRNRRRFGNKCKNSLKFINQWGVSISTTCSYQFIIWEKFQEEQFEIYQFYHWLDLEFVTQEKIIGHTVLLLCHFAYCTSTPLFWLDGKVFVKRPDGVHIFVWGKLGTSTGVTTQHSTHQRSVREGGEFDSKTEMVMGQQKQQNRMEEMQSCKWMKTTEKLMMVKKQRSHQRWIQRINHRWLRLCQLALTNGRWW